MTRDPNRVDRIQQELRGSDIDALICLLPMNVLMLSGYWPVIGNSAAVFTRDGHVTLVVPEDEFELSQHGRADAVVSYSAGSLRELKSSQDALTLPLSRVLSQQKLDRGRIGFESSPISEPASYAAMTLFGAGNATLLSSAAPAATLVPAGKMLARLLSVLSEVELERLRTSCLLAEHAYAQGIREFRIGMRETEVADIFRSKLSGPLEIETSIERADGNVYCMSGENSFKASAAFQRSTSRRVIPDDVMLVHCNSYVDGFWTDITRTFCVGKADELKSRIIDAILEARDSAFNEIRPGTAAKRVDAAARGVMKQHGFGDEFVHGLGHAVGFHAIDHNARPRLHPASPDILEEGMVFNVEPAVYIEGFGGVRHCEMVAVTRDSFELLTPFLSSMDEMVIDIRESAAASTVL
jgi:Xaa-Pro aminopeptidase